MPNTKNEITAQIHTVLRKTDSLVSIRGTPFIEVDFPNRCTFASMSTLHFIIPTKWLDYSGKIIVNLENVQFIPN